MLLENKSAVIYGGGGSIGGAIARAFAREGAKVFLAGRTLSKLEAVAEDIRAAGGGAETASVDALDEKSVERYVAEVARKAGASMFPSTPSHGKTFRELRSLKWPWLTSLTQSALQRGHNS
jgi:NAD(P)-dependent dehydrogenase (short-subunit alcohol dehydrogenase family)